MCQSRKFPCDYQKVLNREGRCASWSHLQTGSETDERQQQLWYTDRTFCLLIELKQSSHNSIICWQTARRYFPYSLHASSPDITHLQDAAALVQQHNNSWWFQQPSTKVVSIWTLQSLPVCLPRAASPLVAIRASWMQFWLSRWVLFWSGSSPHLSGRQGEGMSACVRWSSGKLPSPAPESESCASVCSPEKGSSRHLSPASGSSAVQPGGHRQCTSVKTGCDVKRTNKKHRGHRF